MQLGGSISSFFFRQGFFFSICSLHRQLRIRTITEIPMAERMRRMRHLDCNLYDQSLGEQMGKSYACAANDGVAVITRIVLLQLERICSL